MISGNNGSVELLSIISASIIIAVLLELHTFGRPRDDFRADPGFAFHLLNLRSVIAGETLEIFWIFLLAQLWNTDVPSYFVREHEKEHVSYRNDLDALRRHQR